MNKKLEIALSPLASLYGATIRGRNALYDRGVLSQYRAPMPVLSVGNILVGGSGKSPVVQTLVRKLKAAGRAPVILLRGYGGKLAGPHQVTSVDRVSDVGDEALMHLRTFRDEVPVVISRSRSRGAALIEQTTTGDCIVLDDGLQHRAIARDLDLLVVDLSDEERRAAWENGLLLPAGRLREHRESALRRAHGVIFLVRGAEQRELFEKHRELIDLVYPLPAIRMVLEPIALRQLGFTEPLLLGALRGKRAIAVSATASSRSFFHALRSLGAEFEERAFSDHHEITAAEWDEITRQNLPIVTTAKDEVKIEKLVKGQTVFILDVATKCLTSTDEMTLDRLIAQAVGTKIPQNVANS